MTTQTSGGTGLPTNVPEPKSGHPMRSGKPMIVGQRSLWSYLLAWVFIGLPPMIVPLVLYLTWGWGHILTNVILFTVAYVVTGLGITVGFHRYFTHGAFKAKPWLHWIMAVAGSMAVQGSVLQWVTEHRRHHRYSDQPNDPHSPWYHGEGFWGLLKGFYHAHMGWMFKRETTNPARFAPDLLRDPVVMRVTRLFPWLVTLRFVAPGVLGGLITWSWSGALTGLLWGGLLSMFMLHHVGWATNSVCHMFGERPFESRDRSTNFKLLAWLSFGESYHNGHHGNPTSARHGVLPGQTDISAEVIRMFEKRGWAWNVRWPTEQEVAERRRVGA